MTPPRQVPGFIAAEVAPPSSRRRAGGLSVRRLGMRLFLTSISILFAAALVGVLVVRLRAAAWPPPGTPSLPRTLWVSSGILVVLSVLLVGAGRAARRGRVADTRRRLAAALALGVAFLLSQTAGWLRMLEEGLAPRHSLFAFAFYVLTALHALHVAGGVVPLGVVTVRSGRGRYLGDPEPVELVASYWHFLAVSWIAIFLALVL